LNPKKIIIGTELFSGSRDKKYYLKEVFTLLNGALKLGINQIDTAPSYGQNFSVEKMVGSAIKKNRNKFKLSTKFTNDIGISNSTKRLDAIKRNFEMSLNNLQTSFIDNYFFHSGNNLEFFDDKIWQFLNKLKKKKLIVNLGLALKHNLVKQNSLSQIKYSKNYGIKIISTTLNMFSQESVKEIIPYCQKNKLKIWGRMPLAKGLLSGKYKHINSLGVNDLRFTQEKKISKQIIDFALKNKINTSKALKWAEKNSNAVIVGFKDLRQLKEILNQK
jgi:aryl-alcohol dehydrogenase-like predicted oxidoreductase